MHDYDNKDVSCMNIINFDVVALRTNSSSPYF